MRRGYPMIGEKWDSEKKPNPTLISRIRYSNKRRSRKVGQVMERKHYSPNHPAVMAWQARQEPTVRERRQAVVARARAGKKPRDRVAGLAPLGLTLVVSSGFVFDHAQKVGGDWWLLTGMMLGGGLGLLVEAVRQSHGD